MKDRRQESENSIIGDQQSPTNDSKDGLGDQEILDIREAELPEGDMTLEDQLQVLKSSLEEVTDKAEEYLDGWQRSRAEFANYKKRIQKENADIRQFARGEVIKIFLDVLDDLERALQEETQNRVDQEWVEGIQIIYQKLKTRLEAEGVRPMNPLGEEFDPHIHEALMKEETEDYPSGTIIGVMQEGYWIGDRVLRPAQVRVAA
ncbi:MAG: nucleotide exchange factor GrpE [Anaerolineales bacterium]|jgi:molecular chaperone GrpE